MRHPLKRPQRAKAACISSSPDPLGKSFPRANLLTSASRSPLSSSPEEQSFGSIIDRECDREWEARGERAARSHAHSRVRRDGRAGERVRERSAKASREGLGRDRGLDGERWVTGIRATKVRLVDCRLFWNHIVTVLSSSPMSSATFARASRDGCVT